MNSQGNVSFIDHELLCRRNFDALLKKLHKIKTLAIGKTQTHDIVRTFMLGAKLVFPCLSVRVFFDRWNYEHFNTQKKITLPPLRLDPETFTGRVFKDKKVFRHSFDSDIGDDNLDEYKNLGIFYLIVYPLLDFNQDCAGIVEITAKTSNIPNYQKSILDLLIQELGLFLGVNQNTKSRIITPHKTQSPELLGRLQQTEEEKQQLVGELETLIQQEKEREDLFYSLIRYFRDAMRIVEAWYDLRALTPENSDEKYDFQSHADRSARKAKKFADLLLYLYKMQHQTILPQYSPKDLIELIHESIEEFSSNHRQSSLNLRTNLSMDYLKIVINSYLLHSAILYSLEYLFLIHIPKPYIPCLIIEVKDNDQKVTIIIRSEPDSMFNTLDEQGIKFFDYIDQSIDEYGLSHLFLSFVKSAVNSSGGKIDIREENSKTLEIEIVIPKEPSIEEKIVAQSR